VQSVIATDAPSDPVRTSPDAPADRARFSPLVLVRAAPIRIWVITGLFGLLLAGWSVLVPQYHAPDEPNHADAVMRLEQGKGWPHPGHAFVLPDGVGAIAASPFGAATNRYNLFSGPIPQSQAVPRSQRPAWKDLGTGQQPGGIQQIVQHPPLYYAAEAAVFRIVPGWGDSLRWDVTIGLMRLMSVLMVTPLPFMAWAAARRLTGDENAATVAALVPLAVPEICHIGSVVSNDSLTMSLGGLSTLVVAYILRGDLSKRTAGWAGVSVGLGLFTKTLAVVMVPMVLAAYFLAYRRARRDAPRRARVRFPTVQLVIASVLAIASGAWWEIVSLVKYGTFQPTTPGFPPGRYLGRHWGTLIHYLYQALPWRWWGTIGWFEVNIPFRLVVVASSVLVILSAVGVVRAGDWRRRNDLLVMLWPTVALYVIVSGQAISYFHRTYYVTGISGRYLFAGVVGICVGVGAGCAKLPAAIARWTPAAVLVVAVAIQIEAAKLVGRHFWQPAGGGIRDIWDAMSAWAPWPPLTLELVFALIVAGILAAFGLCVRLALTRSASAPAEVTP
jgi:small subunit ribosomal protein S36